MMRKRRNSTCIPFSIHNMIESIMSTNNSVQCTVRSSRASPCMNLPVNLSIIRPLHVPIIWSIACSAACPCARRQCQCERSVILLFSFWWHKSVTVWYEIKELGRVHTRESVGVRRGREEGSTVRRGTVRSGFKHPLQASVVRLPWWIRFVLKTYPGSN